MRHRIGFHIHLTRRAVRRLAVNDFRHIRAHCATRRLRQVAPRQTLHRRRYRLRHLLVLSARIVVRRRRPAHLRADLLLARTAIPSRYQLRPRRCPRRRVALRRLRVQLALRHQHITHLAPDFTYLLRRRQTVLLFLLIKYRTQHLVRMRRIPA